MSIDKQLTWSEIVAWLASDILDLMRMGDDLEANVDGYMGDLTADVREKARELLLTANLATRIAAKPDLLDELRDRIENDEIVD